MVSKDGNSFFLAILEKKLIYHVKK